MSVDRIPVAHIRAVQTYLNVVDNAWTEAKVGSTALDSRKWVQLFNRSGYSIWYTYDNSLSIDNSFVLRSGGMVILPLSNAVPVYLRATTGAQMVVIAEVA